MDRDNDGADTHNRVSVRTPRRVHLGARAALAALAVIGTGAVTAKVAIISKTRCEFFSHSDPEYRQCRSANDSARALDLLGSAAGAVGVIAVAGLARKQRRAAVTVAALASCLLVAWYALMSYWAYTVTLGPSAW